MAWATGGTAILILGSVMLAGCANQSSLEQEASWRPIREEATYSIRLTANATAFGLNASTALVRLESDGLMQVVMSPDFDHVSSIPPVGPVATIMWNASSGAMIRADLQGRALVYPRTGETWLGNPFAAVSNGHLSAHGVYLIGPQWVFLAQGASDTEFELDGQIVTGAVEQGKWYIQGRSACTDCRGEVSFRLEGRVGQVLPQRAEWQHQAGHKISFVETMHSTNGKRPFPDVNPVFRQLPPGKACDFSPCDDEGGAPWLQFGAAFAELQRQADWTEWKGGMETRPLVAYATLLDNPIAPGGQQLPEPVFSIAWHFFFVRVDDGEVRDFRLTTVPMPLYPLVDRPIYDSMHAFTEDVWEIPEVAESPDMGWFIEEATKVIGNTGFRRASVAWPVGEGTGVVMLEPCEGPTEVVVLTLSDAGPWYSVSRDAQDQSEHECPKI